MKTKILILSTLIALFTALPASAVWTGQQTVYRVYPGSTYIYVQTTPSSAHINPNGCELQSNYVLDSTLSTYDKQYQVLLTAIAAGKKVSLNISGCIHKYPRISAVFIVQ